MCTDKTQTLRDKRMALRKWMVGTSCRMLLVGVIGVFGVLYIAQTSAISTKGFVMSDLQQQVQLLEQESRALSVDIAEHRSMHSIQERLDGMGFVAATQVEYRTPVGSAVARR